MQREVSVTMMLKWVSRSCLALMALGMASCVEQGPSVEVLIERAHLQERQQRLPEAIEAYNAALKIDPQRASVYYDRGVAFDQMGAYDKAFADYTKAVELDKGFYRAFNNRAVLFSRKGDYVAAIKDCDETLLLNPQDALALRNRGYARLKQGQFSTALQDLNESIRIDGKSPMTYVLRGEVFVAQKQYDRAIEEFSQAATLDPKLPDAFYQRGVAQLALRRPAEARRDLDQARQLDPELVIPPEVAQQLAGQKSVSSSEAKQSVTAPTDADHAAILTAVTAEMKQRGFEVAPPPKDQLWRVTLVDAQQKRQWGQIVCIEPGQQVALLPASTIVECQQLKEPTVLLIVRRQQQSTPNWKVDRVETEWLTDATRLRPSHFEYTLDPQPTAVSDSQVPPVLSPGPK